MDIGTIILTLLREGGIAALMIFLGQSYIKRSFDRDLAKFKADLEHSAREHQISFSSVYAKRAEILQELYAKIVELDNSVIRVYGPESPDSGESIPIADKKAKRHDQLFQALCDFHRAFNLNRLYLSEEVAVKMKRLDDVTWGIVVEAGLAIGDPKGVDWSSLAKIRRVWKSDTVTDLKQDIENEFRKLLKIDG